MKQLKYKDEEEYTNISNSSINQQCSQFNKIKYYLLSTDLS